jgi:hypothetical protein
MPDLGESPQYAVTVIDRVVWYKKVGKSSDFSENLTLGSFVSRQKNRKITQRSGIHVAVLLSKWLDRISPKKEHHFRNALSCK